MKTYLNNPVGVRDAAMAEPVQRTVGGRLRYVSCLRFTTRESDGSYREPRERAVLFVDGRLDRIIENAGEPCAGAGLCAVSRTGKIERARSRAPARGCRCRDGHGRLPPITFQRALNPRLPRIDQLTGANRDVTCKNLRIPLEQKGFVAAAVTDVNDPACREAT